MARVLAAAPVGAWMPLEVVVAALRPDDRDSETLAVRVRDGVVALGELLARADAGSPDERVGPAHDLIADFLRGHFGADAVTGAHSAIVQALADLEQGGPPNSVAAYARDRLSEHLWAVGRSDAALSALPELPTPADNLALWQSWHRNLLQRLGPGHPDTLTTRNNVAAWTGRAGDARGALELSTALLPDRQRVLGPDHPSTLTTRNNIAVLDRAERGRPRRTGAVHRAAARPAAGPRPRPPRHPDHPQQHRLLDRAERGRPRRTGVVHRAAARPAAGPRPRPPRHPDHPQQHRLLDRAGRGRPRRTGVVHRAAARPAAGPRPRPPRHPDHPQQHRRLDRAEPGTPAAHWSCSPRCCPTSSGSSAPTTRTSRRLRRGSNSSRAIFAAASSSLAAPPATPRLQPKRPRGDRVR